jgi:hypothetical protein
MQAGAGLVTTDTRRAEEHLGSAREFYLSVDADRYVKRCDELLGSR